MKRRAWKIALGVLGTIVLILGGIVADAHRRAAAQIERERVAVQSALAAFQKRDHRRPSISKDPIDGNAWDYYGPALTAIAAIPDELAVLVAGSTDPDEVLNSDDHAIHNIVRERLGDLERLRQGLRCRSAELPFIVDPKAEVPLVTELMLTRTFLAGLVAHEHRMGHGEEALRIAATGLALGQDCGRYGMLLTGLVQLVCEGSLLETLQPMFGEHTFTPAGLAEFSETLDRLDAARPDFMDCWKGEELLERKLILDQRWDDLFNRMPVRPSWRALWSERITRAQALVRIHECYRQVEELRLLPPWERIAAADKIDRGNHLTGGSSSSGNVLVDLAMPSFSRSFRRDAIAQLGRVLLRVSVAIARFEGDQGRNPSQLDELLPKYLPMLPVCPLTGTPLRYKDGKVWSVGENLVDDGGTVDVHTPDSGGAGDVVWTVKRK